MGFCFFNNVVIGAVKALISGYKKVFIVDFDAHHGNGTQELIGNYSEIFYFSTHQYPFYPGTGSKEENKENIFNIPLPAGTGDKEYKEIYENIFPEKVSNFAPEIILVSAGYDLHKEDPLTDLNVTDEGIKIVVNSIVKTATERNIPLIFLLEGGYSLKALKRCGEITFSLLTNF